MDDLGKERGHSSPRLGRTDKHSCADLLGRSCAAEHAYWSQNGTAILGGKFAMGMRAKILLDTDLRAKIAVRVNFLPKLSAISLKIS